MDDLSFGPSCYSDGDVDTNRSGNPTLESLVEQRYSRRQTMFGGVAALTTAVLSSSFLTACGDDGDGGGAGDTSLTVNAGSDGRTSAGRVVNLSGSTSFVIDDVRFEQTGGPAVTLVNANSANASFIAPAFTTATPLTFRFTGTDFAGRSVSDETVITVDPPALGFTTVARNRADIVTVPEGYTVTVLYRGGDPILAGATAFANNGTDTNWGARAGDHHDGIYYYGLTPDGTGRQGSNSERGLLAMNHENINDQYLHVNGPTTVAGRRPESEAIKEIEAHGTSVVEVSRTTGVWSYNATSSFNSRVTPNTPVVVNGPVRGNAALRSVYNPDGNTGRGTINNCAFGFFLWGTFVTCEENWAGYFRRPPDEDDRNRSARELTSLRRYGVGSNAPATRNGNYSWSTVQPADATNLTFRRWDARIDTAQPANGTGDFRNEPNNFGWCVEVDPYDKSRPPRKRTALGRMGHEGAWHGQYVAGRRLAVYLGDDARNEYFYKFVSSVPWDTADINRPDRLAVGDKYLDSGTLYVARFNADGTGVWIPLVFGQVPNRPAIGSDPVYVFQDQADILLNARLAADAVGATPMDRPEWTATNEATGEIYLTLTNNRTPEVLQSRPGTGTDAANPRRYNDPRGFTGFGTPPEPPPSPTDQFGNPNGHILRLREAGDNGEATTFIWDIYLFGAGADLDRNNINLSGLTAENDFSSPDGIWFARPTNPGGATARALCWIQTDDGAYTDVTNNQMLAALPGSTRDGAQRTITNTGAGAPPSQQTTFVGAQATPATLRRFMVGPRDCEITGVDSTPDGRTLFVNIQHPGETTRNPNAPSSNWPQSQATGTGTGRPRSATVVVTKNDGGVVGL